MLYLHTQCSHFFTGQTDKKQQQLATLGIMGAQLRAPQTPGTITALYRMVGFNDGQ